MRQIEKANATAAQGSARGHLAHVAEQAGAWGIYHGICRGYKGEHQAEYLREWPRLVALRERVQCLIRSAGDAARDELDRAVRHLEQFEVYMHGLTEVKWAQDAPNVVTTVGKNAMLDAALAGSSYTAATYMGLIGAVSYSSVPVVGDTMSSHATWTEGGGTNAPTYSGNRPTVSWSSAASGSKAPSSAPVFTFTGSGTAKGVFIVFGSGASATKDNTGGVLYSAGLFSGGDQAVVSTNTVTVTYSTGL